MLTRTALVAAVVISLPAAAYQLRKDASGTVVRWRDHATFVLDRRLATQMNEPQVEAAVRSALATVAAASKTVSLSVELGDSRGLGYALGAGAQNQNEITGLDDWPYQDEALAVTLITLNGQTHEILDSDIVFNLEQHTFRVLAASGSGARDLKSDDVQNTLTHELGHALGLMHNAADAQVVMYPGAVPGETHKRVLAADDEAGLAELYALPSPLEAGTPLPSGGCSAAPASGASLPWAAVVLALALLRRARPARHGSTLSPGRALAAASLALTLAAPSIAAAEPKALELGSAERVALGEVVATRSSRLPQQSGLIVTDLTIRTRQCLKGVCAEETVLRVPGGVVGELEQEVLDHPVPRVGAPLVVLVVQGRNRLVRLDTPAAWDGLRAAALKAGLPPVGSPPPQLPAVTPRLIP